MHRPCHRSSQALLALVTMLAIGVPHAAFAGDSVTTSQPSAIERPVRQEAPRASELARLDAVARENELSTMLDAREQALIARPGPSDGLDPAIRTAMIARASAAAATAPADDPSPARGEEFAWGAAALGLGAGVAAMCVLLGCVTLVRSHGRLRSV